MPSWFALTWLLKQAATASLWLDGVHRGSDLEWWRPACGYETQREPWWSASRRRVVGVVDLPQVSPGDVASSLGLSP